MRYIILTLLLSGSAWGADLPKQAEDIIKKRNNAIVAAKKKYEGEVSKANQKAVASLKFLKNRESRRSLEKAAAIQVEINKIEGGVSETPLDLEGVVQKENAIKEKTQDQIRKALLPDVKKHGKSGGLITYNYSPALEHKLDNFPSSRRRLTNRKDNLPVFPLEPRKGKILSPEFRTGVSLLRIEVKGASLVFIHQGFRGNAKSAEKYINDLSAKGWILVKKTKWLPDGVTGDYGFMMVRVCADEVISLNPKGSWKETPTVVFSSVGGRPITVRETR